MKISVQLQTLCLLVSLFCTVCMAAGTSAGQRKKLPNLPVSHELCQGPNPRSVDWGGSTCVCCSGLSGTWGTHTCAFRGLQNQPARIDQSCLNGHSPMAPGQKPPQVLSRAPQIRQSLPGAQHMVTDCGQSPFHH